VKRIKSSLFLKSLSIYFNVVRKARRRKEKGRLWQIFEQGISEYRAEI
jgi:hypothetical protein